MELRALRYFLTIAQEGNITKAAEILHITQPTLSRQMINLENELGTHLFQRGRYQTLLTEEGILLQQRAREILALADQTEQEIQSYNRQVSGVISIASVESTAMHLLPDLLVSFSRKYPMVHYDLYSSYGDHIKENLDKGIYDIGIMTDPVDLAKYSFVRLPQKDRWGILTPVTSPFAGKQSVRIEEIANVPLLIPKRELLQSEIANWFDAFDQCRIFATYGLLLSAVFLVEKGFGHAVCLESAGDVRANHATRFIPFEPERSTHSVMIWKKNRTCSPALSLFIDFLKRLPGSEMPFLHDQK